MKLAAKTHYGTRAILDLAINQNGGSPVPLKDIAERQKIPLSFLEHIVAPLISAGLINSVRGVKGGISLAKTARDITLKEVVEILEGPTAPADCVINPRICPRSETCATRDVWSDVKEAIDRVLISTTLEELAEKQANKGSAARMYFI